MSYLEECNKYFAPLDEIQDALENNEGLCGLTYVELHYAVAANPQLQKDLRDAK